MGLRDNANYLFETLLCVYVYMGMRQKEREKFEEISFIYSTIHPLNYVLHWHLLYSHNDAVSAGVKSRELPSSWEEALAIRSQFSSLPNLPSPGTLNPI